jgi:hypothetical protein
MPLPPYTALAVRRRLGLHHPDPNNDQLEALQGVLRRLSEGAIPRVESESLPFVEARTETKLVTAAEWIHRLHDAYIWIDFRARLRL